MRGATRFGFDLSEFFRCFVESHHTKRKAGTSPAFHGQSTQRCRYPFSVSRKVMATCVQVVIAVCPSVAATKRHLRTASIAA
jgi:hypothetical protein